MKRTWFIILLILVSNGVINAQSIFSPNYALKSPLTVEVLSIETVAGATTINLSIENQLDEGYFCIDKNSYIITDKGVKLKLLSLTGLSQCPDVYRFTHKGEIKFFSMMFPAIDRNTAWIDVVEECESNCLSIFGLSLGEELNSALNSCFIDIEKGRTEAAIKKFEALRLKMKGSDNPILGSVYLNLVSLYTDIGDRQKANELKAELQGIILPHKEKFVSLLK